MTTENGLPPTQYVRRNIEHLIGRMEWLQSIPDDRLSSYQRSELRALEWAIPVLEVEYDSMIRLKRRLDAEVGRNDHLRDEPVPIRHRRGCPYENCEIKRPHYHKDDPDHGEVVVDTGWKERV